MEHGSLSWIRLLDPIVMRGMMAMICVWKTSHSPRVDPEVQSRYSNVLRM